MRRDLQAVVRVHVYGGGRVMELDYLQALMGGALEEQAPEAEYRNIWVVTETRGGDLAEISKDMLGRAREMADMLGVRVGAVLLGQNVVGLSAELVAYGADIVYVADSDALAQFRTETYLAVLADVIADKKPEIVLVGATARGRDLAPRLATRLKTGLISECVALDLDESERLLLGTRASYGGLLLTQVACPKARPQIATVRPGCLRAGTRDAYREGTTEEVAVRLDGVAVTKTEDTTALVRAMPLCDARVVVCGGRGIGGAEGFKTLEDLAAVLGGTLAASRSAVEFGWVDRKRMVDITGTPVHPDLYVAVATSGGFPQRVAWRGTRCLVAINKDARAPIFARVDYGLVGDWREVVPELINELRRAKES